MTSLQRPVTRSVYVMVLTKDLPSPLAPESDEEKPKEPEKSDKDKPARNEEADKDKEEAARKEAGHGGDRSRKHQPAHPGSAHSRPQLRRRLAAGKTGVLFLVEGPAVDPIEFEDGPADGHASTNSS